MGLFKKTVYVATTIVYDEEAKRITATGIISVHKSYESACAALHTHGYTFSYTPGTVIDDQGRTRVNAWVFYNPTTLAMAHVREMALEK